MSKKDNGLTGLERYLLEEIGVEFKACIYFFCYLFYISRVDYKRQLFAVFSCDLRRACVR